jgi:hypothetical protein
MEGSYHPSIARSVTKALGGKYLRRAPLEERKDTAPSAFASLRRQNPREEPGALAAPAG